MSKQRKVSEKQVLNVNLRVFVLIGLVFLLFYPPFLRGLFFAPELLISHMFTAVLFALCWFDKMLRRDLTFIRGGWDYAMLAFVGVYVLSFFGAVNERGAVGEILKVINYVMVYWITYQFIRDTRDVKLIYRAIFFSAVGVAVVGIGAAMGLLEYPGAISGNRINSVFQYPNTTGAFVALGSFLGLGLLNTSESRIGKIIYGSGNMLLMTVFIASQSRGTWVVFPLVLVLYFIGMSREFRFPTLFNLTVTLSVGLQVAKVLIPRMQAGTGLTVWKYLLVGAVVVVAAQWFYDRVIHWLDERGVRESTRQLLRMGFVGYVAIVFAVYIIYTAQAVPSVAVHFAPTDALNRADTINAQSAVSRFDLYKAALKAVIDYPINGLGGEGWNALYHQYMPYLMFSSETHSYPAKVAVETGLIGFISLLGLIFFWGRNIFTLFKARLDDDDWLLVCSGSAAAFMIFAHSIIDFDLSYGAVGIGLWALWGTNRAFAKDLNIPSHEPVLNARRVTGAGVAGVLAAGLLFFAGFSLYTAGTVAAEGAKLMSQRDFVKAEVMLKKASLLDPFSASYPADLAHIYTIKGLQANDPTQTALAARYSQMAVDREPYNYQVRLRLLILDIQTGRVEQAVDDAESLVAHNPLDIHNFEILAKVYITSGRYLDISGKKDKAREYWEKALQLGDSLKERMAEIDKTAVWQGDPLRTTALINLYQGEAAYFLGNYDRAHALLTETNLAQGKLPESLQIEARQFLDAVKDKKPELGGRNG